MVVAPEAAVALCRIGRDTAAAIVWGASAYRWVLVPPSLSAAPCRPLGRLRRWAIPIAVGSTAALLPCEAATIGEGWADAADLRVLGAVLFETTVGWAWQVQAIAAMVLAASLAIPGRFGLKVTAGSSGLLLASLALTGHAAMHAGWLGIAHRCSTAVHILAAGAWLGALVALGPILRALDDPRRGREAVVALRRFSKAGHVVVALAITTGLLNARLILGFWPLHAASAYSALLAVKMTLVAVMAVLAIGNRYVLVPRLQRYRPASLRALRLSTLAEALVGVLVIALVGVFGLFDPA